MKHILIIMIIGVLYGCTSKPAAVVTPPLGLPVETISASADTTYHEYPASIEGMINVDVRPQVSGLIARVFVDEGAYVKSGQPLFEINRQPFQAVLSNALAGQHSAEGAAANAKLEVEKLIPLVQNKVVSVYQLKTARASLDIAYANIEQAKANVKTARINLGYTVIKAPVNGYIGRLLRKQGSVVSPADTSPLTQLSDIDKVHVYFSLSEMDFVSFKNQYPGLTLSEKLRRLPPVTLLLADHSKYNGNGRIDMIDGQFDKNTAAITLRATFQNPQGLLRSGNTGQVQLSLRYSSALTVPQSATAEVQDKTFIFLVGDSNKVKKQFITIIGKSGTKYLVKDGIKAGDRVVLTGIDHLQEGMVISPQESENQQANN